MQYPLSGSMKLRTNLADYPVTKALKEEIGSRMMALALRLLSDWAAESVRDAPIGEKI